MGSPINMKSTTDSYGDQTPTDEALLPKLDCSLESKEVQLSESQGNCQGGCCNKEYGEVPHNSNESCCDSSEDLDQTEEDGQLDTPGHMRESMSSFTGRPGIKGRNETIRMMLLCAVHCMFGQKAKPSTLRKRLTCKC